MAGLCLVSLAITSCLDSNENLGEYSPDATIHAFVLDTIHGVNYKFTIDQFGPNGSGLIYNQDSLPVGSDSIIDKILIQELTTASGVITIKNSEGKDSLFNYTDSLDLRKPLTLKVWSTEAYASGGLNGPTKEYQIKVNVHRQDPDSMGWTKMSVPFANVAFAGNQKSVILGDDLFVYTSNTTAYKSKLPSDKPWEMTAWEPIAVNGLLATTKISSITPFAGTLYAITEEGDVYSSAEGKTWTKSNGLSSQGKVEMLLCSFPGKEGISPKKGIAGIIKEGTVSKFCTTNPDASAWGAPFGEEVLTTKFPMAPISSVVYTSATGIQTAILVGNNVEAADTTSIPWMSQNGEMWIESTTTTITRADRPGFLPNWKNPSIMHYNQAFYVLGGDFSTFYQSAAGIAWYKAGAKFWIPTEFKGRTDAYSMVVDKNNFIWITWNSGEVWRGRLNKLGFDKQ